jgi:hypothetical protein
MWSLVAVLGWACDSGERPNEAVKPAPTVLVRVDDEAPGAACTLGGRAIRRGPDRNGDGQLSDEEVEAVDHVCRSEASPGGPAVLMTQTPESPGTNCAAGGVLVRAGADTNGNGLLEDAEVTRSFYGCQAEPQAAPKVRTREKNEPPGTHCAEGGVAIQAGADTNRDGVLSDDEVETTAYVCGQSERAVLTKTEALAAGTTCSNGGSRVLAGRDDNADNVLDASEVETSVTICNAREDWTYYGDYTIRNAADVVALTGVGHIDGGLLIQASTAEQIELPLLKTVRGLVLQNNPLLKRVSTRLQFVMGSVVIQGNPLLEYTTLEGGQIQGDVVLSRNEHLLSFSMNSLTDVSGNVVVEDNAALSSLNSLVEVRHIGGSLTVKNNASLESSGWAYQPAVRGPITLLGQLSVVNNPKLKTFDTVLERVGRGITLQDNPKLLSFGVEGLTALPDSLVVRGNTVLSALPGLGSLRSVGGDLHLEGLRFLDQLHLEALEHVGGDFRFIDNDAIYGLQYLTKLVSIGGALVLTDNLLLSDPRFSTLRSVDNGVVLERNANLTHVGGLSSLRTLQGLVVNDNPKLTRLTGLAKLETAYAVEVSGNPELTSLELSALSWVETLTLTNNTKLPTCLATALRTQVEAHLLDSTISGNLEPSTCP